MTCLADHNTHVSSVGAKRLLWLDASRTVALLAMVVFHFARDLEFFGVLPSGVTMTGGWAVFARVIAGSFLFLSGVSLIVAHGSSLRLHAWARRLVMLVLAALLVSMGTYVAFPQSYVYFGMLHVIAACSLIGVLVIGAPAWALIVSACLVLVADANCGYQPFVRGNRQSARSRVFRVQTPCSESTVAVPAKSKPENDWNDDTRRVATT